MTTTGSSPTSPAATGRRTKLRAMAAAITVTTAAVLPPMLTGTMAERMRGELGIGETTLGLALAVFFATSGALAAQGGRLADRIGWARAGRLGAVGSGAALLGIALLATNVWILSGFLALGGAAMGAAMPAGSLAIARELPPGRQGLLFGIKQTSIPLAGLFAGAAVPAVALTVGWQWAFGLATVFPLAALVLLPSGGRRVREDVELDGEEEERPAPLPDAFRLLALGGAFAAVAIAAMAAFLVVAAVDAGISEGRAGALVSVASAVGLTVRVTSGWLADRFGSSGFHPATWMITVGATGFVLLAVHVPVTVLIGALVAYGAGWGWPGLYYFGAVVHGPQAPAAATGRIQVGLSTGSALGPLLFGIVAEAAGFPVAWGGAAVLMAIAAVLIRVASNRLGAAPGARGAATPRS